MVKVLYTAHGHATGGRTGEGATDDGKVNVKLSTPKELGGDGASGTNPEQLFSVGYSACFLGALKYVASQKKVMISDETTVSASVGIGPRTDGKGFGLDVALSVTLPGIERAIAEELVAEADIVCPYSHLAHNGTAVRLSIA